nr:ankyrin repeat domain-containing protein 66-like [Ciona intestinalis]|eukprot:XP_004226997.1 ankyrin repeat domain-containing protein 66-like [Ciona intestinalis]
MSVLHEAVACGDTQRLGDLLQQTRVEINEQDFDWDGRTPLFWAVIIGNVQCARMLLQAGANPTILNNDYKSVAHFAAENGRYDLLKMVVDYGCDVTVVDKFGDSAIDYALVYGHLECADLLSQVLRGELRRKFEPSDWLEPTHHVTKDAHQDIRRRLVAMATRTNLHPHDIHKKKNKLLLRRGHSDVGN